MELFEFNEYANSKNGYQRADFCRRLEKIGSRLEIEPFGQLCKAVRDIAKIVENLSFLRTASGRNSLLCGIVREGKGRALFIFAAGGSMLDAHCTIGVGISCAL
jgi:hypothetical protein